MTKEHQRELIKEYYQELGDFTFSKEFSDTYQSVYTLPDSKRWLVIEDKGGDSMQARLTDNHGIILSWDNYEGQNTAIRLTESVRLAEDGSHRISFSPEEVALINRFGDYDRHSTWGVLDMLAKGCGNPDTEAMCATVRDKVNFLTDSQYTEMYNIGKKRDEVIAGRSLFARMADAKVRADEHNVGLKRKPSDRSKEMIR